MIKINANNIKLPLGFALIDNTVRNQAYADNDFVKDAGDVNNDGYDDFIISSPTGISIIFGRHNFISSIVDISSIGNQGFTINRPAFYPSNDPIVLYASSAGDVNNDGYNDIIIGLSNTSIHKSTVGYIIYGSLSPTNIDLDNLTSIQALKIIGEFNNFPGCLVSGAGDINHDNFADVLIIPFEKDIQKAHLIFGGDNLSDIVLPYLNYPNNISFSMAGNVNSGLHVSSIGDINNDAYDDFIVSDFLYSNNNIPNTGKSYIIYGKNKEFTNINLELMNLSQGFTITETSAENYFGWSVNGIGDINNDGYNDFIITSSLTSSANYVHVFYGKKEFSNIVISDLNSIGSSNGFTIKSNTPGFGSSVSNAGDINGDGINDIIIGSPFANSNTGIVYIIYGGTVATDMWIDELTPNQGFLVTGEANNYLGWSVSKAGDINNDGFSDILIGTFNYNSSYLIFGGSFLMQNDL